MRLLGISVSNLQDSRDSYQMNIFNREKKNRKTDLNKAVDAIKQKFGRETINPATLVKK